MMLRRHSNLLVALVLLQLTFDGTAATGQVQLNCYGMGGTVLINATQGSGDVTFDFRDLHWYRADDKRSFVNITAAIHVLPTPYRSKCQSTPTDIGPIYDPTGSLSAIDYESLCRTNATNCAIGDLRSRLGKIHGANGAVIKTIFPANNWHLSGPDSIVGRTLVLYNQSGIPFACGLIERRIPAASRREVIRRAVLAAPVGGEVTFRQIVDSATGQRFDAQIIVHLFYVNGAKASAGHGWYLDDGQISSDASCDALGSKPNQLSQCSRSLQSACLPNDLAGKHGSLTIESGEGRHIFFTDTNLNVEELGQKALVVSGPNESAISCGNVNDEDFHFGAIFDGEVKGSITFQPSVSGTLVRVNLTRLNNSAGGYHIHVYPVQNGDCKTTGGHLDPFGVKGTPKSGSMDMYEVGDLSGLFGSFAGKTQVRFKKLSHNLRLSGQYGVVGRSIVIHNGDGGRWQCADIVPMLPGTKKLTAVARFVGKFEGMVKLTQWQLGDGRLTDTMVDIDIKSTGSSETQNHNWHVHNKPAAGFPGFSEKNCAGPFTSGHYNPYNVDLGNNYTSECSASNPLRCELGDLSGKHAKYNIYPKTAEAGRRYSSDPNLPLTGPLSVIGRSIVIHAENAGGPRISCASIYPDKTKFFSVMFKKPATVDNDDIQAAIAQGMKIDAEKVQHLSVNTEETGTCTSATFVVPDDAVLGNDFLSVVPDGKFGNYQVDNDCLSASPTSGSVRLGFSLLTFFGLLLARALA